jgi:anhydro-N-acetylmuramic acid kinase
MSVTVGLMSGTSMDGVDAAAVRWDEGGKPRTLAALTRMLPAELGRRLWRIRPDGPICELMDCDAAVAECFAEAALEVIARAGLRSDDVDAIGSHGQTVWHAPDRVPPVTLQIGDPNRISELTGLTVVADFRRRDVAAGGQGAPLAPLFHAALFASDAPRAVVNLGGIANVSWLLPDNDEPAGGYDIGPANTLLDAWYRQHHDTPAAYDRGGVWAASGRVLPGLLDALLADPFFRLPPPRSTGPEYFNLDWLRRHDIDAHAANDVQATLLELTARSVADCVRHSGLAIRDVLICGGGAANRQLMDRLRRLLAPIRVADTAVSGVDPGFVEAVGFAWLARRTLDGLVGNSPAVTGARRAAVLGGIYPGCRAERFGRK